MAKWVKVPGSLKSYPAHLCLCLNNDKFEVSGRREGVCSQKVSRCRTRGDSQDNHVQSTKHQDTGTRQQKPKTEIPNKIQIIVKYR